MIIGKYNIAKGASSNARTGSTAVAGGGTAGTSVDITPLTNKIAALESRVSQLENQLTRANALLSGLDARFLSRLGDRSVYSYAFGALHTDHLSSEMFDNGAGFELSGNATDTVENKYNLVIKDVGWALVAFSTVMQSEATVVDTNTDSATAQLNATNINIGATSAAGYLLVDCGAQLTNERCFTMIGISVRYAVTSRIGNQHFVSDYMDAGEDGNGHYILSFPRADEVTISIRLRYTYAFSRYGDMTSGTYRLYVRGTDPSNNRTDCFAAASKSATVNASGFTVMSGNNGMRLTSSGMQTTTDGGETWV